MLQIPTSDDEPQAPAEQQNGILTRHQMPWRNSTGDYERKALSPGSYVLEVWRGVDFKGDAPYLPSFKAEVNVIAGEVTAVAIL